MKLKKIYVITLGLLLLVFIAVSSVSAAPNVIAISPSSAYQGTTNAYTVHGSGFLNGAEVLLVSSGGFSIYATDETTFTSDVITCSLVIPIDAPTGYYTLWVQNPGEGWSSYKSNAFSVGIPLTISSISPSSAYQGTSGTFYIYGSGFQPGVEVYIYILDDFYYATEVTTVNSGVIRCSLAIPTDARTDGPYGIEIRNPFGYWIGKGHVFNVYESGSITVTSPNGWESWARGTPHTVMWDYTGNPGSFVKITLLKGATQKPVGTIKDSWSIGTGGKGSYTWDINPSGTTGSDYKVKVQSISQPTINDTSNNFFTLTPLPTHSITVTSPHGGETWQRGTPHTITWSYTGSPGSKVKIGLVMGDVYLGIANDVSIGSNGKGSYTWDIPSSGITGSGFKISVYSISQPAIKGISDKPFTLTPAPNTPSITVTVPNGGESWQRGTTHTVTWDYTGDPGPTVMIVLLKAGQPVGTATYSTSIGLNGKGSYPWTISSGRAPGNDYQILIQSVSQPSIKDTSDGYFTITSGISIPPPSITVTSPNGGETWKRGTTQMVKWSFIGNPGSYVKIELLKGSTPVGTATYSTSIGTGGKGSYSWAISSGRAPGTNYRIRVTSVSQPTIKDASNNNFTITL